MSRLNSTPRRGFTLVELMIVIGIIATLIALLLPAINGARETAKRSVAQSEMAQLGSSLQAFKTDKRIAVVPSLIVLREKMDYDSNSAAETASLTALKQIWPQLPWNLSPGGGVPPGPPLFPGFAGIDWNGDGSISGGANQLDGDQCLVFFLGGIPQGGIPSGFATNPSNPAAHVGNNTIPTKSYFNFPADRLMSNGNTAAGLGFQSFADPWKTVPYAYYAAQNGTKNKYSATDCPTLTTLAGAHPYQDKTGGFFQPTGWQIISAGRDKNFGTVTTLIKGNVTQTEADGDNMADFIGGALSSY